MPYYNKPSNSGKSMILSDDLPWKFIHACPEHFCWPCTVESIKVQGWEEQILFDNFNVGIAYNVDQNQYYIYDD